MTLFVNRTGIAFIPEMLEVCNSVEGFGCSVGDNSFLDKNVQMKHPKPTLQTFEFNLGKALELRCVAGDKQAACNNCESCRFVNSINQVKSWFPRLGDQSKRRFLLGLVRRFHSVDLLQYVSHVLQPLLYKDYTYSRARTNPTLGVDRSTVSGDRALEQSDVDMYICKTWEWFGKCNYWSKANFTLVVLQLCDSHLLYNVGVQAKTLLASEEKAAMSCVQTYTESETIAESELNFDPDNNPDLDLLAEVNPHYSRVDPEALCGEDADVEEMIENNDSGDESLTESQPSTLDPTILVIPASAKAHSGVSRYRDFVRCLPVHLGKYILSRLDKASLYNALCVSRNWRRLAEEVHREFFVNQQLLEEVMLMQGGASQGANPNYANDIDVLVPNIDPQTWEVITTADSIVKPTFKSEINWETSYSGVSTRKVIMEERNVYCGAYNVMVLTDQEDQYRQVHTDGGKFICIGSKDRKVRLLDGTTGRETGPLITGHAGSVRCVFLCEEKNIVLSGSYDTSIRVWNIETGQCLKILRGHRDTVLTVTLVGHTVASGAKDGSCKIWNLETGKCLRSFRHKDPVGCVALDAERCVTGCEGGKVKVWDLTSGNLIKRLNGHHGPITGIKFDSWHIVTASKDCYALVWSAQGNFTRCLAALRHQKEVLCLEFMYLRVITGSADGRLRIWNMVTGQCCRIMRGNSRSDPILSIIAVGDRITLNTQVNLLVLNFEKVNWDYSLENDKVPPLVQYGKYSDAPTRMQPYPYIRAQRMQTAGATNMKIVKHGKPQETTSALRADQQYFRAEQIPHSAKMLSARSLSEARLVQSGVYSDLTGEEYSQAAPSEWLQESWVGGEQGESAMTQQRSSLSPLKMARAMTSSAVTQKSRPHTSKSAPHVLVVDPKSRQSAGIQQGAGRRRRVSWAFETPQIPKSLEISLSETKALLRSQIRMKDEHKVPPDFIYLAVNTIQSSMKPTETNINTVKNMHDSLSKGSSQVPKKGFRPSSSPSRIDPRTRVPIEDLGLDKLCARYDYEAGEGIADADDGRSTRLQREHTPKPPQPPPYTKEVYATDFKVKAVRSAQHFSTYSDRVPCSLPTGRSIRPQTSYLKKRVPPTESEPVGRPVTAIGLQRPITQSSVASALPGLALPPKQLQLMSSSEDAVRVPMLMYSQKVQHKITSLKENRQRKQAKKCESGYGNVSEFNDPLRSHAQFDLKTFQEEEQLKHSIDYAIECKNAQEMAELEKERRTKWLIKANGHVKPKAVKC